MPSKEKSKEVKVINILKDILFFLAIYMGSAVVGVVASFWYLGYITILEADIIGYSLVTLMMLSFVYYVNVERYLHGR